jgi:hypothetical protein
MPEDFIELRIASKSRGIHGFRKGLLVWLFVLFDKSG